MNPEQNMPPVETQTPEMTQNVINNTENKSFGTLIGIIVIVIVLVVGAFYFWGQKVNETITGEELTPVSESDEVSAIEEDLSIDPSEFDVDMSDIESDF